VQRRLVFRLVSSSEPKVRRLLVPGLEVNGPKVRGPSVRALLLLRSHGESSGRAAVSDSFRGSPFFGVSWGEAVFYRLFHGLPLFIFGSHFWFSMENPGTVPFLQEYRCSGAVHYASLPYPTGAEKARHNVLFNIPRPTADIQTWSE
jgi:hypothetical protein